MMSDAGAFTILGIVALVLGWPWWAIAGAFLLALLMVAAESRSSK